MSRKQTNFCRLAGVLLIASLLAGCGGGGNASSNTGGSGSETTSPSSPIDPGRSQATIKVLSNRADLISGGSALVEIDPPNGIDPGTLSISLNVSNDVRHSFALSKNGKFMGLVEGLRVGNNVLTIEGKAVPASSITMINHPSGGPVFSGPQIQPWTCQAGALDAQCNQAPMYSWMYLSTNAAIQGLQPYNPVNPPKDVATTTSEQGLKIPFIVRIETGYQDRSQYQIAALYQPGLPWTAADPQPQFNHKMVITHGSNCGVNFGATNVAAIVTDGQNSSNSTNSVLYALGKGYAIMATALDNSVANCNVVTQAESLVMAKEHLIENYGTLGYTIGIGCSGGSLAEQWIQNAYPGIYQALLPSCSFPDAWSAATQLLDNHLLLGFFDQKPLKWTEGQKQAIYGATGDNSYYLNVFGGDAAFFSAAANPSNPACAGVANRATVYDANRNRSGLRCSLADWETNIFGKRSADSWIAPEKSLGYGFTGRPMDNVGVQYGLSALQAGVISTGQFIDLNNRVGGMDIDGKLTASRVAADQPALQNAYRSGLINEANNLNGTPIVVCLGSNPVGHDTSRTFALRARLDNAFGNHDNHVIFGGPASMTGSASCFMTAFRTLETWLNAIQSDQSTKTLAQKVAANKPKNAVDSCFDANDKLQPGLCSNAIVPVYSTPRVAAGDSIAVDKNKCQLKPLNRADNYGPVALSDQQWAQMQAIFPTGVCDFTKPGVGQAKTVPWMTYQNADGSVIYGGTSMPPPPANSGSGWASPVFAPFGI